MHLVKQSQNVAEIDGNQALLKKIEQCLHTGCVVRIQHTPVMAPRFTPWQEWCQSCFYEGDPQRVYQEIERCRATNIDHHIRLVLEDFSCHSRFAFVVHSPMALAA